MSNTAPRRLSVELGALPGVGPERAQQLTRLNLITVNDLLLLRPRRYEDRRCAGAISELRLNDSQLVRGAIVASGLKRFSRGRKSVFEIILEDGTGRLHCRWWNAPYMQKYFEQGDEIFVYGKLISNKPYTIDHPELEIIDSSENALIHLKRIAPIYPLTEGISQRWLRSLVWRTLEEFEGDIPEPWPNDLITDLPDRANAVHMIHFPEDLSDIEIARQRLALDEFIDLQIQLQKRRRNLVSNAQAPACLKSPQLIRQFLQSLRFSLTNAQNRVLQEICDDMAQRYPMRRLLHGDVGCGKTVVAACTAILALGNGLNVILMAPTEILAEQHFRTFKTWFADFDFHVSLRTSCHKEALNSPSNEDASALTSLSSNPSSTRQVEMVIGTHALIQDSFTTAKLGLVIIDEQHKFGVTQRERLLQKGRYPHLLVMTATPIPRTLGLTLYGDLDTSVIDQAPAGRGLVRTFLRKPERLPKIWDFVRQKLSEGRQAYVVYPRISESDNQSVKAVSKECQKLRRILAPFKVALLHGQMKSTDKEVVMTAFRKGDFQVLAATNVIEVGVDVANATVMVIENAEQFGLAQLHQLRGRIGRGAHESFCILVSGLDAQESLERLQALVKSNDGFQIAEFDLKLRGPGELLGQQQSGLPKFRFGNLAQDYELLVTSRRIAAKIVS
jgi:ATP-dependent DNA helicase RecG